MSKSTQVSFSRVGPKRTSRISGARKSARKGVFTPREYQKRAYKATAKAVNRILNMPTGAGKTFTMKILAYRKSHTFWPLGRTEIEFPSLDVGASKVHLELYLPLWSAIMETAEKSKERLKCQQSSQE